MPTHDCEKGAGVDSPLQHPRSIYLPPYLPAGNQFPPTYERNVNDELQRFDSAPQSARESSAGEIVYPQKKKRRPVWFWFLIAGFAALIATGAIIFGTLHLHSGGNEEKTSRPQQILTAVTTSASAGPALQTRAEATVTVSVTAVTSTVFVTMPRPPPTSVAEATGTMPTSSSSMVITTEFDALVAASPSFSEPSSSSTTSPTPTSIASEASEQPSPPPTTITEVSHVSTPTETFTETSTTTASPVEEPTPEGSVLHPIIWRCGVHGMFC